MCSRSLRSLGLPIYVARVPAAPFASRRLRERGSFAHHAVSRPSPWRPCLRCKSLLCRALGASRQLRPTPSLPGLRVIVRQSLGAAQETVIHIDRVNIDSGDRIHRIVAKRDSALAGTCARARNVERGDGAVRSTHEAVTYITRVNVVSLNRSCLVDAKGKGALERACACARSIERGHSAVRSAQDAVIHIARVKWGCRDRPCGVEAIDGKNNGALAGAGARVRSIKCSDGAVRSAQEAVTYIARVNVASATASDGLMLPARVPWPGPVPAPA